MPNTQIIITDNFFFPLAEIFFLGWGGGGEVTTYIYIYMIMWSFFNFWVFLGGFLYWRAYYINFEGYVQSFYISHGLLDLVIVLSLHVSNYSHVIKKLKISALGNRKQLELVEHMSSAYKL